MLTVARSDDLKVAGGPVSAPRRAIARVAVAIAIVALVSGAVVAELQGHQRRPLPDFVAGCVVMMSGVLACTRVRGRVPGLLLVAAGMSWFVVTAGAAGGDLAAVARPLSFVHRGLLIHALVASLSRSESSIAIPAHRRLGFFAMIALGYIVSIDRDLAQSTPWVASVGISVVACIGVEIVSRRSTWRFAGPAVVGTVSWVSASSFLRSTTWPTADARFALYCFGVALVAVSIAGSTAGLSSRGRPGWSGDIVRDGGLDDVRFGFQHKTSGAFHDIAGQPFEQQAGESTVRISVGNDLGDVVVAYRSDAFDAHRLERQLADGLRLLAGYHRAVQVTRSQADEVAASEQRIRAADDLASAELSLELDHVVAARVRTAIELLSDDRSFVGVQARESLFEVLDEVQVLAAGLAPSALDNGLDAALAAWVDLESVCVHLDLADAPIDRPTSLAIYFAAVECITNAVRHGAPSQVDVSLATIDGATVLMISDDGRGGASIVPGGGLDGLRTRVGSMGGSLDVSSEEGGTVVTVHFPLVGLTSNFS